jgi:uncharacterized protein YyaL (SSP411 family)
MIPAPVEIAIRELRHGNRELLRLVLRDLSGRRRRRGLEDDAHLDAAIQWLCRAQDATASGGVARSYCVAWHPWFRTRGWLPAYPETTGYIIPTMFDYARLRADDGVRQRAIAMAEWEIEVQMPSGAVQGGVIGMAPTPAIFNTGQVIFGWLRAAREAGEGRFVAAAERAGRFLLAHQDDDGVWRRDLSQYAKPGRQTYNTRTAWALIELAETTGNNEFRAAGVRNIEAALKQQHPNGWFEGNCLNDEDAPLTHTIAYATRGILESGALLGDERYLSAACAAAQALLRCQHADGSLCGRYDKQWRPRVRWSCLTGNAQVAIIWLRLAALVNEPAYIRAATRSLEFLASLQLLDAKDEGIRGGIAGAYPIYGDYGRLEYLNWAAKFFADGLMLKQACAKRGVPAGRVSDAPEMPEIASAAQPGSFA